MCSLDEVAVVVNRAICRRILHQRAKNGAVKFEIRKVVDIDFNSEGLRAGLDDFDRLRMTIGRHEKSSFAAGVASPGDNGAAKRHRFSGSGCFV